MIHRQRIRPGGRIRFTHGPFCADRCRREKHHGFERFSRAQQAWLGRRRRLFASGWRIGNCRARNPAPFRCSLRARDGEITLDLTLQAGKPVVLQGDPGLEPEKR
ncbi:MAG: hypothetical protein H6976_08450 [Gammaproteobacteria bacterium]|nr:hypothetical protein [Gammaproteobacteria bacterium]